MVVPPNATVITATYSRGSEPRGRGMVASYNVGTGLTGVRLFSAITMLWLAAIASPAALAEEVAHGVPRGQRRFRVFAGADGLRNLVIGGIAQDRNGFLWVATDDGVYRFNGERFTHFSVDHGLSSSLNFVVAIGPDGAPCVGSPNGLVCWNGTRFSQSGTRGLPRASIHAIVTFTGKLWVGTDRGGLYVQDGSGGFIPAPGWPGTSFHHFGLCAQKCRKVSCNTALHSTE